MASDTQLIAQLSDSLERYRDLCAKQQQQIANQVETMNEERTNLLSMRQESLDKVLEARAERHAAHEERDLLRMQIKTASDCLARVRDSTAVATRLKLKAQKQLDAANKYCLRHRIQVRAIASAGDDAYDILVDLLDDREVSRLDIVLRGIPSYRTRIAAAIKKWDDATADRADQGTEDKMLEGILEDPPDSLRGHKTEGIIADGVRRGLVRHTEKIVNAIADAINEREPNNAK